MRNLVVITAFVGALAIPAVASAATCMGTETGAYYANSGNFDGDDDVADFSHTKGRVDGMGQTHSMASTVYPSGFADLSAAGCPPGVNAQGHDLNGFGRALIEASTVTRAASGALLNTHSDEDGENCFLVGGGSFATTRVDILGGTGKFEGATGTGIIYSLTHTNMSDFRFGSLETTAELDFDQPNLQCK